MNIKDAIIIGSGHNGLVTGSYLAKAGHTVKVIERRPEPGGAVATETMFRSGQYPGGFQIDIGSSVHIMIHQTKIVEELELEKYGLEYINMDPIMSYPVPEEKGGVIHFFKDLERTLDSIARVAPEDVANYQQFIEFWERINDGVLQAFLKPPTGKNLISVIAKNQVSGGGMFQKGQQVEGLQKILSSYGKVVDDAFENPHMKAALTWFAAQSGPLPGQPATGDFTGWQSMLHQSGAKHPRGGSGMLSRALVRFIEDHGGEVVTDEPVQQILIEDGTAIGVRTNKDEYRSSLVISNAHIQLTMLEMVGADYLPDDTLQKVQNINVGNGFGMVIRCAVEELPRYRSCPADRHIRKGMQLLAPSVGYLDRAIGDYLHKKPPEEPAVLAMTLSEIDDEMAPSGGDTLYAWAQWHPYELQDGMHWDDIRQREADKIYDVVCNYAPNMEGKLIDRYIQTPLDIERKHAMPKGNVMHVEMSFDQMFMFRPLPSMNEYKTPIKNLYLSSASCHPGGGVFGAAGYNAAQVILKDLNKKTWFKL